jgi:signal transduction histidine kinase
LWVGTSSGVACLDPESVKVDRQPKPLYIDTFQADGRTLVLGGLSNLPRQTKRLTFSYRLLSFFREAESRFQVQLVGLETEPKPWSSQPFCEFGGLPAGSYRFRVWGKDYAGNVSGPVDLSFKIRQATWETGWFQSLSILGLGLAIWGIIRWWTGIANRRHAALEAMVKERTEDLAHTNEALREEVETRLKAQRAKDEFVAVVSHELRTPLTSIHGALGIMNSQALAVLPERIKPLVEIALRNSLRLQALVNDLLDIQKIESGALLLTKAPTSLNPLVDRVVEGMAGYAQTCGVEIEVSPPATTSWVAADATRLEQVLANLLSNACKHSPEGVKVQVRLEALFARARVSVVNRGEPIPLAFRPHLFQKFATADASTTRAVGGTGLGLAICKAILEHSGGRIGYDSTEEGTTFWFELPTISPPEQVGISS